MYLKQLEVENFKSFKGEAVIPFDRGFTAITGPNGSGKSNCGDAIQFVLGARSSKVLRAQNSKDLIFNGGKSNRPARNAKVTLVFANPLLSNGRRRLQIDSEEVRMTREVRLTKSNNVSSTYLLNGEETNQKAFHRLLGQANARPDGYNIVLQGDVTRLSSMTSVERRKVLDSVAGVTSYDDEIKKADKQRLQVEDFIERISLVEEEQKSRLKTLESEKKVAEQARSTKEAFDKANIVLYQTKYLTSKGEIEFQINERTRLLSDAASIDESVITAEKELLALDDNIGELQTQIDAVMGGENSGLTEEIRQLQLSIDRNRDKIEAAQNADVFANEQLEELEEKIIQAKNDLSQHLESLKSAKGDLEASLDFLKSLEEEEESIRESLESSGSETAKLSKAVTETKAHFEKCQIALHNANLEVEKISNEAEIIANQLSEAEEEEADAQLNLDDIELQIEEYGGEGGTTDRTKLAEDLIAAQSAEKKLIEESNAVERKFKQANRDLSDARIELEKKSGNNGMAPGAAAVMAARDRGDLNGILGTIGELCAPRDPSHEDALVTAVGNGMNSVVVENDQIAVEAMAYLRNNKLGRATFLPLNKIQSNRASGKATMVSRKPGVLGFAHELLDYDPRISTAVAYALRNTLVVDNMNTARSLMGGVRLVTLRGEVTEAGGAMVGGAKQKMKTGFGGKIQGASEVEKLVGEVNRLSLLSETVSAALREARSQQSEIRGKINALANNDQSQKLGLLKGEMEGAKKALVKAKGKSNQLRNRLDALDSQHAMKQSAYEVCNKQLIEAESAKEHAEIELTNSSPESIQKQLFEAQSKRMDAEGIANKASILIESGDEKTKMLNSMLDSITARADEIQGDMAGREVLIKTCNGSIEIDTKKLEEKEEEFSTLLAEHKGLDVERNELIDARAELRAKTNSNITEAINKRSLAEDVTRSIAIKEQALVELLAEMAEEQIPVVDDDADLPNISDAERAMTKLRKKLDSFGDFNMLAIEQYDACKERLDEMKDDFKTLQARRKKLIDIADKLESQRKTRLVATLKEVNENFKVVYNRLSNGGRGELFLENPDEPFKGGLDMWAQPRGKSNKSRLQALSGGEKSMASLSLIFAIQDHDPSPFYYFDEVDQNLDVPNSKLIAMECRNRSEAAQFIMVTLRKVSLELADHHIGITHGGDGCSRRIVDFDRARAIELGEQAEKEATEAADKNHSRIEEARAMEVDMPEVPEPLPAPKILGGLLKHINDQESEAEEESENAFASLAERAEELTEDIQERQDIVSQLLEDDDGEVELQETEEDKEV